MISEQLRAELKSHPGHEAVGRCLLQTDHEILAEWPGAFLLRTGAHEGEIGAFAKSEPPALAFYMAYRQRSLEAVGEVVELGICRAWSFFLPEAPRPGELFFTLFDLWPAILSDVVGDDNYFWGDRAVNAVQHGFRVAMIDPAGNSIDWFQGEHANQISDWLRPDGKLGKRAAWTKKRLLFVRC